MNNGTPFTVEKISPRAGLELGTARSAGQLLTHWGMLGRPVLTKHHVIGQKFFSAFHWSVQFSFFLLFVVTIWVIHFPERSETGLITESDQTVRAVHSC